MVGRQMEGAAEVAAVWIKPVKATIPFPETVPRWKTKPLFSKRPALLIVDLFETTPHCELMRFLLFVKVPLLTIEPSFTSKTSLFVKLEAALLNKSEMTQRCGTY